MTCIIGLKQDGKVYIGGDSLTDFGYTVGECTDGKVFRVNEFLIGSCGDVRFHQLVRYGLAVRPQRDDESDMGYLVLEFARALRECFKEHGLLKNADGTDSSSGSLIIGYRGNLYLISHDFSCCHLNAPFVTIGSGQEVALGAMAALAVDSDPVSRITTALTITAQFINSVRAPFYVEML